MARTITVHVEVQTSVYSAHEIEVDADAYDEWRGNLASSDRTMHEYLTSGDEAPIWAQIEAGRLSTNHERDEREMSNVEIVGEAHGGQPDADRTIVR